MMSKKDYEKAVVIVKGVHDGIGCNEAAIVAASFMALFEGDNPRFDEDRFMDAVGKAVQHDD